VDGDDAALATAVAAAPGALVAFRPAPTSDLAHAVGLRPGDGSGAPTADVPVDAVRLGNGGVVCNAVVLGPSPDRLRWTDSAHEIEVEVDGAAWFTGRATTVVIANGQFLRGADLVPRGHPGDGRLEVQVYALGRAERRAMRRRLATGAHVPHPRIHTRPARVVDVRAGRAVAVEADGVSGAAVTTLHAEVVPAAFRLLL
jgi:hypothetical protein